MLSRITNAVSRQTFLEQLNLNRAALEDTRNQIGTGVKLNSPSDDPARTGFVLSLQRTVTLMEKHENRIGSAVSLLENQDTILQAADATLLRAKEIAAQAANETISSDLRKTLSEEVFNLRDTMQNLANTSYRGVYLWGGLDDDDPPYDVIAGGYDTGVGPATDRYVFDAEPGTDMTRTIDITETETARLNSPADAIFSHPIAVLERLGRALAGYTTDPPDYYDDGNGNFVAPVNNDFSDLPTGIGGTYTFPQDYQAQTAELQRCMEYIDFAKGECIGAELTNVGSRLQRLENARVIVESVRLSTEESRASVQDADMFATSSKFQQLLTNLQGLLSSGAKIESLSLLDYL